MLTVHVTRNDVERGLRSDCSRCPVALALCRATGRVVGVTTLTAVVLHGPTVTLPADVSAWIRAYDRGERVAPFSFEIDLPTETTT